MVRDVPTRVKYITDAELTYITGSAHRRGQKRVIPVVSILTNLIMEIHGITFSLLLVSFLSR